MIQKVKFILDFVGNKILNAKVNNPTDNEHITNKQYVDEKSIYNTTLATTKQNSTKFDWVKNVGNNTIKSVLDKILFPVVNPVYENPFFSYLNFTSFKKNIIANELIDFKLVFEITNKDRTEINDFTVLEITDTSNNIVTFNSNETGNKSSINFKTTISAIAQIKIKKQFNSAPVKNDSDGNPFIDNNFNSTYTLEKIISKDNFLNYIQSTNIFNSFYYKSNFDKTNIQAFLDSDISTFQTPVEFVLTPYAPGLPYRSVYLFLIHPDLVKQLFILKYKDLNNIVLSTTIPNFFENHILYNSITPYTKTINGINYIAVELDFGKTNIPRKLQITLI